MCVCVCVCACARVYMCIDINIHVHVYACIYVKNRPRHGASAPLWYIWLYWCNTFIYIHTNIHAVGRATEHLRHCCNTYIWLYWCNLFKYTYTNIHATEYLRRWCNTYIWIYWWNMFRYIYTNIHTLDRATQHLRRAHTCSSLILDFEAEVGRRTVTETFTAHVCNGLAHYVKLAEFLKSAIYCRISLRSRLLRRPILNLLPQNHCVAKHGWLSRRATWYFMNSEWRANIKHTVVPVVVVNVCHGKWIW